MAPAQLSQPGLPKQYLILPTPPAFPIQNGTGCDYMNFSFIVILFSTSYCSNKSSISLSSVSINWAIKIYHFSFDGIAVHVDGKKELLSNRIQNSCGLMDVSYMVS